MGILQQIMGRQGLPEANLPGFQVPLGFDPMTGQFAPNAKPANAPPGGLDRLTALSSGGAPGAPGQDMISRLMARIGNRRGGAVPPVGGAAPTPAAGGGGVMGSIGNAFGAGAGGGMDITKLLAMFGA